MLRAKVLAGIILPAATLVRQASRAILAALVPVGFIERRITRFLTGTVASSASFSWFIIKEAQGTITPQGQIRRAISKALTGSVFPGGSAGGFDVEIQAMFFAVSLLPTVALERIIHATVSAALKLHKTIDLDAQLENPDPEL